MHVRVERIKEIVVWLNMEYYIIMKTNDLQLHAITWINCTNIMGEHKT